MITYIICSAVIVLFSFVTIKAVVKERRYKKKQLTIAKAYDRIIRECKLAVEYSEFLCYRYIGLDRRNKKLVLIDHSGDEKQELCIPLPEIEDSRILHIKDETQKIKAVVLELRNKRNNKAIRFCFYDKEHDPEIEMLTLSRKAIHWKTKVDIYKHPGSVSLEAEYVL